MNSVYRAIGIKKQSFHQKLNRSIQLNDESDLMMPQIDAIRKIHPKMSSRQMYKRIKPVHLGRDRFEAYCFKKGLKVKPKPSFQKTTNSLGTTRFLNLTPSVRLTGVNQVWVSDITYYRIGERFFYLTFIMDLYSRFIVGYSVSDTMMTEHTTIPALRMAYKGRPFNENLIIHSDGGGQYYDKEWKRLTTLGNLRNSMGETVYENAHAERLNGTLKNDYIIPYGPSNRNELIKKTHAAILAYNYDRGHSSLKGMCPDEFEKTEITRHGGKTKAIDVDNSRELPTSTALLRQL